MTEEIEKLLNEIGGMILETLPEVQWTKITIEFKVISTFASLKGYYLIGELQKSFNPQSAVSPGEDNLTTKFIKLREATYELSSQKGAWYTAVYEITPPGRFNVQYDYDQKPKFKYEPSPDQYVEDAKRFPRSEDLTPDWLKEILKGA